MEHGIRRNCFRWLLLAFLGLVVLGILDAYNGPHSAANQKLAATNVAQEALDRGQFSFAKANIEGAKMVVTGNAVSQETKLTACAAAQASLKEKSMLGLPGVVATVSCSIVAPGDAAVAQAAAPAVQKVVSSAAVNCQAQLNDISKLGPVQFAMKGTSITAGTDVLDKVAQTLGSCTQFKIEIGGHTDSGGDEAMNLNLSQRRANAVRTYLVNKGVAADRLIAKGYGETKPLVADRAVIGVDSQDRAKNRRTEFTIVSN